MIFGFIIMILLWLALIAFVIISQWRVFTKAGQPGWAVFIPVYNILIILKVANKPWWWIFLLLIPVANIVFMIIILNRISKSFGKSEGFTVGLVLLGIVFWGILAFDSSQYTKLEDAPATV